MSKFLFALALSAGLAATSRADFGVAPVPQPGGYGNAPAASCTGHYGWNPLFKKLLWWKKDDCNPGMLGKHGGAYMGPIAPPGPPVGGTLVFPNHPYARSPRDYFMYGQGGS